MTHQPSPFQERLLVDDYGDSSVSLRREFAASWPQTDDAPRPLFWNELATLLDQFHSVAHVSFQAGTTTTSGTGSSTTRLDSIPIHGSSPAFPPSHVGPSGAYLQVHVRTTTRTQEETNHFDPEFFFQELVERGLVAAPLTGSTMDSFTRRVEVPRFSMDDPNDIYSPQTFQVHQIFLPTSPASFSADALELVTSTLLPISACKQNLIRSMDLSRQLISSGVSHQRQSIYWELSSMFGQAKLLWGYTLGGINKDMNFHVKPTCPLADFTAYKIDSNGSLQDLSKNIPTTTASEDDSPYATPDDFGIAMTVLRPNGVAYDGTLHTQVTNQHEACTARVLLRQVIPSFIEPEWKSFAVLGGIPKTDVQIQVDRSIIEVETYLTPSNHTLDLFLSYQPKFLSFEQFPGDPNRGMELPPAVAQVHCIQDKSSSLHATQWLYSNTVLVLPPVPDMSMPFNVISLTCSLYAYVFGSLIAILVHKSSQSIRYKLYPDEKPKSFKDKLRSKLQRWKRRRSTKGNEMIEETGDQEKHEKEE